MQDGPNWAWAIPLIAASSAFLGVVISNAIQRRNSERQLSSAHLLKISDMRQAWINNLRDAMATFQSYGVTPSENHEDRREWYEAGTKIELLMNPNDPDYEELQNAMYAFFGATETIDKYRANPKYLEVCQRILKREWEVLKSEIRNLGK